MKGVRVYEGTNVPGDSTTALSDPQFDVVRSYYRTDSPRR